MSTCEPLRVWCRLEPRARRVDFDRALEARVHDPLWMLARQWQFGEFKGEDTGSAILTKLATRTLPIASVRVGGAVFEAYAATVPLETRVEQLPIEWTPVARAQAGRRFLALLDRRAAALPQTAAPYDRAQYRKLFAEVFPLSVPEVAASDAVGLARRRANGRAYRMSLALASRAVDGVALAAALSEGMTWSDLPGALGVGVQPDHADLVLDALEGYRAWFAALYHQPGAGTAWNDAQLEYQFACAIPREGGQLVVSAEEYASGRLDWYSFDQGPFLATGGAAPEPAVTSVIAAPAEFAGMPNPRWWQLEDGAVDLGDIRADTTDVAKITVAEFALLYGNNWLVVPFRQPVGSLAEVDGIVVTDVFGWRTSIAAATGASGGVWTRWDYFSLSPRAVGPDPLGQHLFLPPAVPRLIESEPIESVSFVRDEQSNTVWAVETRISDGLGASLDGAAVARRFRAALAESGPAAAPPATLCYRLGTSVPENWIPFVPVHRPQQTRAIRLQRAAMPRFFAGGVTPVRPLTSLLAPGLRPDGTQDRPYFVNEEEVPSSGIVVEATMQRARWTGGRTVIWNGRRKFPGRGEGGSGLRFDVIESPPAPRRG